MFKECQYGRGAAEWHSFFRADIFAGPIKYANVFSSGPRIREGFIACFEKILIY